MAAAQTPEQRYAQQYQLDNLFFRDYRMLRPPYDEYPDRAYVARRVQRRKRPGFRFDGMPLNPPKRFHRVTLKKDDSIGLDEYSQRGALAAESQRKRNAWDRLQNIIEWFGEDGADFEYQKCLGYGGFGLATHWKWQGTGVGRQVIHKDVVLKISMVWDEAGDKAMRTEFRATRKLARAEHAIQALNPRAYSRRPRALPLEELDSDDSSDPSDEDSSNSDTDDNEPDARTRRDAMTQADKDTKLDDHRQRMRDRRRAIRRQRKARRRARRTGLRNRRRRQATVVARARALRAQPGNLDFGENDEDSEVDDEDYVLLEYMPRGDLANMLEKVNDVAADEKTPNRILWSFFLCLIRACIGMGWYPRKFHPNRHDPASNPLTEDIPAAGTVQERQMKRMVHFDIDPRNILIDDNYDDDPEHELVPPLKMADFGLAEEIKTQKRDYYYQRRRHCGKRGYHSPEQFTEDWDALPTERNGGNVCNEPIAGNYGPPMNIWHVGLLITRSVTPLPPQPSPLTIPGQGQVVTYGGYLDRPEYASTDGELRLLIKRCLCHDPGDRPSLRVLFDAIRPHVMNPDKVDETDEQVDAWLQKIFNDAGEEEEG